MTLIIRFIEAINISVRIAIIQDQIRDHAKITKNSDSSVSNQLNARVKELNAREKQLNAEIFKLLHGNKQLINICLVLAKIRLKTIRSEKR